MQQDCVVSLQNYGKPRKKKNPLSCLARNAADLSTQVRKKFTRWWVNRSHRLQRDWLEHVRRREVALFGDFPRGCQLRLCTRWPCWCTDIGVCQCCCHISYIQVNALSFCHGIQRLANISVILSYKGISKYNRCYNVERDKTTFNGWCIGSLEG